MENSTETKNGGLSWHKPQVQQLTSNLDTQTFSQAPGTLVDFAGDG